MQLLSAAQIRAVLDWEGMLAALHDTHLGRRPLAGDLFLGDADYGLFGRGVILPGRGAGMKLASIHPANATATPPRPTEDAVFVVIDGVTKAITAVLDGPVITAYKTAADSALAARRLSREDSRVLLVVGAGPVARTLTDAYLHIRPSIDRILLWNRSPRKLEQARANLQDRGIDAAIAHDLDDAVSQADIVSTATSATEPLIRGTYVQPGTHVDLVGGFRPDMREADSDLLRRARVFVDDRQSAAATGDIQIPLKEGVIDDSQIEGDLYDLCRWTAWERWPDDITVYKNAGGAHLDLIVSQYVIDRLC